MQTGDVRAISRGRCARGARLAVAVGTSAALLGACATVQPDRQEGGGARTASVPPASQGPVLPTSPATGPTGSVHPVTTVVVTDDPEVSDDASSADTPSVDAWPGALAAELAQAGTPLQLEVAVDTDAVFGSDRRSFTELVQADAAPSTQVVLFYETRFGETAAEVERGAEQAFGAVEEVAPDAVIVVVAPWAATATTRAPASAVADAVRAAADASEVAVTYVDPAAEGWGPEMTQVEFAHRLFLDVAEEIGALARSGAFD